ncbi:MAG TPA: hypothetical protein VN927_04385 [Gemmatimonadaceae bacterium]|nr:hypothetical protein [Gemmatimonadaceae bacterium]
MSRPSSLILRPSSRFPLPAFLLILALVLSTTAARSQPVLLQIRPHIGDTLRMHLSQTVEMTGTTPGVRRDTSSMTTSIEVFTRAIAEQYTSSGTLMQTITDSVAMTPASAASLADLKRRAMQSKPVWLRVSADGGMEMVDDGDPNSELRHIFGEMPAVLTRSPVAIGEKWTREMQIPLSSEPGAVGSVRATFRLDSLGRNGDIAYISMRGTMSRINTPGAAPAGPGYGTSGQLSGTIQIDRRLGWITDSKSSIIVRSTIESAPNGRGDPTAAPMQVRTKITQWIRAMRTR